MAGLLAAAQSKFGRPRGQASSDIARTLSSGKLELSRRGQPPDPEAARCRHLAMCTTSVEFVYASFMLWVCICVFCYARWMSGALTVADIAELSLQRISAADAGARDPMATEAAAAGSRRLSSTNKILIDDLVGHGGQCPSSCLDLRQLEFLGSTMCVCDPAALTGLYDNAIRLYNWLRASLALLLVMYGSAGVALIYTSALLGRTDGRSELELVLDSCEGDREANSPAARKLPGVSSAMVGEADPWATGAGRCRRGSSGLASLRARWARVWNGAPGPLESEEPDVGFQGAAGGLMGMEVDPVGLASRAEAVIEVPVDGLWPGHGCRDKGSEGRVANGACASAEGGGDWAGAGAEGAGRCCRSGCGCSGTAGCGGGGDGGPRCWGSKASAVHQVRRSTRAEELSGVVHVCVVQPAAGQAAEAGHHCSAKVGHDRHKKC